MSYYIWKERILSLPNFPLGWGGRAGEGHCCGTQHFRAGAQKWGKSGGSNIVFITWIYIAIKSKPIKPPLHFVLCTALVPPLGFQRGDACHIETPQGQECLWKEESLKALYFISIYYMFHIFHHLHHWGALGQENDRLGRGWKWAGYTSRQSIIMCGKVHLLTHDPQSCERDRESPSLQRSVSSTRKGWIHLLLGLLHPLPSKDEKTKSGSVKRLMLVHAVP